MKRFLIFLALYLVSFPSFALPSGRTLKELKVIPRSEIFFTQTENCYELQIEGIEPAKVQLDLPELPLGTKFISSKKEEFITENGKRGTQISLWFTFSESGNTRIPPLGTIINGRKYFFEFEKTYVYENPALLSPIAEVIFQNPDTLENDKKTGKKLLRAQVGQKISFTVMLKYASQVNEFKNITPKNSIFRETKRYEFANGEQKITQFTTESKKLADFEWQILSEGTFSLPEIIISAISYNGIKKQISLPRNIVVSVSKSQNSAIHEQKNNNIFESAFTKIESESVKTRDSEPTRSDYKKLAEKSKRGLFNKLLARKFAIFAGGTVFSVPEEKTNGQNFTGGQKVMITEQAGEWSFIECQEFSGWTKNDNIFEIK